MTKKKQTKAQKIADQYTAFKCMQNNEPIKRSTARDGSIATHPIFDVPDKPESKVLEECQAWLKSVGILAWRNNTGSGTLGSSGFYHYGITDGGDITGLLPDGKHFEIECKKGKGGRWTVGQQTRCLEVRENKGLYFLVHGVEELEYYFKGLKVDGKVLVKYEVKQK
ncbi:MAG: hypothetical protein IMZ53_06060 [Thermoplasmata archaeon]|nr:hypothetical protein [Thermoplasmata archaeon]